MVIQSVEQDVPTRLPVPGVPEMENDLRTGYYAGRVHLYSCTLDWMCTLVQLNTCTVPGDQRGGGLVGAGRGGGGQVVIARRVLDTARI